MMFLDACPGWTVSSKHGSHPKGPPHATSNNAVLADSVTDYVHSQVFGTTPVGSGATAADLSAWDDDDSDYMGAAHTYCDDEQMSEGLC